MVRSTTQPIDGSSEREAASLHDGWARISSPRTECRPRIQHLQGGTVDHLMKVGVVFGDDSIWSMVETASFVQTIPNIILRMNPQSSMTSTSARSFPQCGYKSEKPNHKGTIRDSLLDDPTLHQEALQESVGTSPYREYELVRTIGQSTISAV